MTDSGGAIRPHLMFEGERKAMMKFVVVNHRTPLCRSTCLHCSRLFGASYLRDVSTQKPFCDYDCYRKYAADRLFMPWFDGTVAMPDAASHHVASLGLIASVAAATCWGYAIPLSAVSLSLLQAALGFRQLMAAEPVPVRRPG
jgi:hypothetical protein